ncbi:MAG: L-threonylcarbamoyladenylate synthase [Litorilinea sp.]
MTTTVLSIIATETLEVTATLRALLAADGIFVAPTDTVYGLFSRYDSPAALARIYAAKDRPPQKAIPVLIGDPAQLDALVPMPLHPLASALMARFWPGPLTLVLPALPHLPAELTAGAPTVAVRLPAHAALGALLTAVGPLAATSANRSGQSETHSVAQVLEQLDGRVDLILGDVMPGDDAPGNEEAAPARFAAPNLASTIVDLSDPAAPARILREGPLGAAIREFLAAADGSSTPHADRD